MIAIIGAGITGLVTAAYLKRSGIPFRLFDSREVAGGNIRTLQIEKYKLELGPNSLVLNDELYDFLQEWRLGDSIVQASEQAKYRFVLKQGKYKRLPTGPLDLLTSSTFSLKAKRALLKERKLGPLHEEGDTIDQFFRKRIGDEWTDYVVQPFISGVFAGDTRELLMEDAFPRILQLEQEHGSLLRGMMANRKKNTHRGTVSLLAGMQNLTDELSQYIKNELQLSHPLLAIRPKSKGGYTLQFKQGEVEAEKILLTLPAYQIAKLLESTHTNVSNQLKAIEYSPVSMVFTAYKRHQVQHKLNGFGVLHNHKEESFTLGSIFNSSVFPDRCPEDEVLLTTFVGGALYPSRAKMEEVKLKGNVHWELQKYLTVRGNPVFQHIQRWPKGIPQYKLGARAARNSVIPLRKKGLYLGGNWTGGISVPDSIQSGRNFARELGADMYEAE
ncbi:MAG: protoporphyrinogen oxidase [Bacteroidota bacterium]